MDKNAHKHKVWTTVTFHCDAPQGIDILIMQM